MPLGRARYTGLTLTEGIIAKTYELMYAGNYRHIAASILQIKWTTWSDWRTAGENLTEAIEKGDLNPETLTPSQKLYIRFYHAVSQGEADAEKEALETIQTASKVDKNWQAAAWYLSRKHPERWSEKQRVEHTGLTDRPIVVQIANQILLDPQSRMLISQLVPKLLKPQTPAVEEPVETPEVIHELQEGGPVDGVAGNDAGGRAGLDSSE